MTSATCQAEGDPVDDALCFERSVHQIVLVEGLYLLQQQEGSLACNDLPGDVANKKVQARESLLMPMILLFKSLPGCI